MEDQRWATAQAYAEVFLTDAGRRVLQDLEARFAFHTASMYQGDVNAMLVNEGSRKVLVHVGNMLTLAYEAPQQLQEKAE